MTTFESPGGVPRGRKASMVWTRDEEDVATCGLHFLHADGTGVQDFTNDDSAALSLLLVDVWDAIKTVYPATIQLSRIVWHSFGVDVRRPNPADFEHAVSPAKPGTQSDVDELPAQVAVSVTFKTSRRRNWGRVYLPAPDESAIAAQRFVLDFIEQVRTAFGTLADAAAAASTPLVVWSPRHDGGPLSYGDGTTAGRAAAHAAGLDNPDSSSFARTVDIIQVDDVPDVIRRRRLDKAISKVTHTTGA